MVSGDDQIVVWYTETRHRFDSFRLHNASSAPIQKQGTRRLLGITGQPVRDDKPSESDKGKRNRPPLQKRPNKGVPAAAAQWVGALFTAASVSAITGSQPIGFTSS